MPAYKLANQNHRGYALKTKQGQRTKKYMKLNPSLTSALQNETTK